MCYVLPEKALPEHFRMLKSFFPGHIRAGKLLMPDLKPGSLKSQ